MAGNFYGRKGYPLPNTTSFRSRQDGQRRTALASGRREDFRLADLITLDLRLQKAFELHQKLKLTVSAEPFNALNEGTEVRRDVRLNRPQSNFLLETRSPRVWRFGLRLGWR